ncbi:sacsin N-terminal ATP-binding-like domain-containing protein [Streptomyces sp. ISL-11]|uniref:sacsin N-terminal ATP-binding-like domain-containing protein n=1 Tax=Streptomyces sp. ISL-11 TaxID=2819174 RepID=UPI001BE8A8B5|nr:molecular chaperone Hsp90 [Streptomyces sp. ISL-11]MBT2387370.1 molecular chaperone Hsp90 [Streptomyces sp. ISL-11]
MVRGAAEDADPFGTGRLRHRVLEAWAASPARFREDANAEEDLALGGYRDRLVVELAQNAADAAARAGTPGRLRLTLRPARDGELAVLAAANTGAPLDAQGVESLATLRASAKRESGEAVGRFGVGFSAVLAVSDEPAVVGRSGGVRWSLAEARDLAVAAAASSPGLGEEIRRRNGHVPLLRLPLPAEGTAPEGYDTVVVLPLRDGAAEDLTARLLAGIDDALLLALPGLEEVVVEGADGTVRTLTRRQDGPCVLVDDSEHGTTRWRVEHTGGPLDAALLADRPVEERLRPAWSLTWAVPVGENGAPVRPRTAPVLHAPTPTDEPQGLPALLIATFPLEPTRRHTAPGPLTDFLTERAAEAYTHLLRDWHPVSTGTLDLVPSPLARSPLDAELRRRVLELLPRVPFLPSAATAAPGNGGQENAGEGVEGIPWTEGPDASTQRPEGDGRTETWDDPFARGGPDGEPYALCPRDAEVVEGAGAETVTVLGELFPSLLPTGLERRPELRALGVARVPLGEVVDRLAGVERAPSWWWRLYDSLAGVDPDRLTGLPVPLAGRPDGAGARTAVGPRQVLLPPADATGSERLSRLGLKVAHPDAAHPLLEKLGATPASPRAILTTPQVRAAVADSLDGDEIWDEDALAHDDLVETVLALVRDANLAPGDEPWLAALALADEDGELAPAGELVLPGSPFESVIRPGELAACDAGLAERWGEQPLTAVGVLADFALVRATDVVLDPDELEPRDTDYAEPDDAGLLDAVDVWCEDVLDQLPDTPVPPVATEIVAVRDLDLVDDDAWPRALALLSRPPLRDALTAPVRVLLPDGTTESVRPYTAWWLRGHPVLDGRRPAGLRVAGGDPLLAGLYEPADAAGLADDQVLRALGVRTSVAALLDEPGGAAELLSRLADPRHPVGAAQLHALYGALAGLDPEQVTLPDDLRAVVDGEVRVVDAADALVADAPDLLPLAEGLPLLPVAPARAAELAELLQVRRLSETVEAAVPGGGEVRQVPEGVRVLLPGAPDTYVEHEELVVDGVELDWRHGSDGVLHAATLEGVAAGLAWAAGAWSRRFEAAALLEDPSRTEELAGARWFD